METGTFLVGRVAVVLSLVMTGAGHAAAQAASPQRAPDHHHMNFAYQSQTSQDFTAGKKWVHVLRGDVKMGWTDGGPVPLTIHPEEMILDDTVESTLFHIPMDRATLRVTITNAGTVFEDKRGHRLTVVTQVPPNLSSLPAETGTAGAEQTPAGPKSDGVRGFKGF